jgi:hypothetical protein
MLKAYNKRVRKKVFVYLFDMGVKKWFVILGEEKELMME